MSPGVGVHYWNDARGKPGGVAGLDFGAQIPRNLLVNGGFTVNQRAVGVTVAGGSGFVCDRWFAVSSSANLQVFQIPPSAFSSFTSANLRFVASADGVTGVVRYAGIESIDSIKLQGQSLTLAVSYVVNVTGNTSVTVKVVMGTGTDQNFTGSGSYATGNSVLASMTLGLGVSNTLLTQVVSFNTPSNLSELSLELDYTCVTAGFADKFDIMGFSLAQGNAAIPYNVYSFGMELSGCQRYFQRYNSSGDTFGPLGIGMCLSGTVALVAMRYVVQMRAAPVVTQSGNWAVRSAANTLLPVTSFTAANRDVHAAELDLIIGGGGLVAGNSTYFQANNSAAGDVFFDAEL